MSFIKTADSEILSVIKTAHGNDEVMQRCAKCGEYHTSAALCAADKENKDERPGKDK